jgi:outer membrane receptor protein involved in Fe transport
VGGVLAIGASMVALAQPDGGIPTVVVQAEKREAPIQNVPIAISALSSEELTLAGIGNADGLAERLTTFDLQRSAGLTTTSLRVRRVGNIGNIPTFEPAVGVFVDGAFRSRSFLGTSHLLAVDHVEVLRGPQTALYGKNVSAGLLAVYTRRPSERFAAEAELTHGRFGSPEDARLNRWKLDLSGPIAPRWSGGIAAEFSGHEHTLLNVLPGGPDGNDGRQTAVRGQLAWSPADAFDIRLLSGYLRERDDQGESDVFLAQDAASTQVSALLQALELTPGCADNVPRNRKVCSVATNKVDVEALDLTLLGEYRLRNDWTFTSMTSWDRYEIVRVEDDAIQLFAPMVFYHDAEQGHSIQEEMRLESAENADFTWLVGGFYYRNVYERGDRGQVPMFGANGDLAYHPIWPMVLGIPLAIPGQLGVHDSKLRTRYLSAFGHASWRLTPRLRLNAGLRWEEEEKNAVINNSVTSPGVSLISAILTPAATLGGQPVNGALARRSENIPWSITPQYHFADDAMAYFTVARGSKSGGFNTGFGDAPLEAREFDDEGIRHYELGIKASIANRRGLLSAAAFYTRYDDYQDSAFISAQFSVGNAERVDLEGVEFDVSILLHDRLTMDMSVSFADLEYATNTNGLCHPGREPDGSSPNSCLLSGKRPIHAPEWETHLGLQYEAPVKWGEFFARFDWSWSDAYNTSFSADPRLVQDAYHHVAARIGIQIGARYDVVLWGDNLLDETVSHFDSLLNLFNDASYQSYLAAPRSYGMTFRLHF